MLFAIESHPRSIEGAGAAKFVLHSHSEANKRENDGAPARVLSAVQIGECVSVVLKVSRAFRD